MVSCLSLIIIISTIIMRLKTYFECVICLALQSTTSHWFLGSIDRIHTGLIPANYVQPMRQPSNSSITLRPQTPLDATVN